MAHFESYRFVAEVTFNGLLGQATMKHMLWLRDCSGQVQITLTANLLYFLYFHPRSELISC